MTDIKVPLFEAERLRSLKVGDMFESEGPFQGVVKTPCVWTLKEVDSLGHVFGLTYMGVSVGSFSVETKGGSVGVVEL